MEHAIIIIRDSRGLVSIGAMGTHNFEEKGYFKYCGKKY